jgi:hypothetical protein
MRHFGALIVYNIILMTYAMGKLQKSKKKFMVPIGPSLWCQIVLAKKEN